MNREQIIEIFKKYKVECTSTEIINDILALMQPDGEEVDAIRLLNDFAGYLYTKYNEATAAHALADYIKLKNIKSLQPEITEAQNRYEKAVKILLDDSGVPLGVLEKRALKTAAGLETNP